MGIQKQIGKFYNVNFINNSIFFNKSKSLNNFGVKQK